MDEACREACRDIAAAAAESIRDLVRADMADGVLEVVLCLSALAATLSSAEEVLQASQDGIDLAARIPGAVQDCLLPVILH